MSASVEEATSATRQVALLATLQVIFRLMSATEAISAIVHLALLAIVRIAIHPLQLELLLLPSLHGSGRGNIIIYGLGPTGRLSNWCDVFLHHGQGHSKFCSAKECGVMVISEASPTAD